MPTQDKTEQKARPNLPPGPAAYAATDKILKILEPYTAPLPIDYHREAIARVIEKQTHVMKGALESIARAPAFDQNTQSIVDLARLALQQANGEGK